MERGWSGNTVSTYTNTFYYFKTHRQFPNCWRPIGQHPLQHKQRAEDCIKVLRHTGHYMLNDINTLRATRDNLYNTVDGLPLREQQQNPDGQGWLTNNNKLTNSKTFKQLTKLRIGGLAALENCNRRQNMQTLPQTDRDTHPRNSTLPLVPFPTYETT